MRSLVEWLLALVVLAGIVWFAAPLLLQWIPIADNPVTLVEIDTPALPKGVPRQAQNVPFVMLPDGAVVRVGIAEKELKAAIPGRLLAGPRDTEEGVFGERHIQAYRIENSRFWVILERTAPNAERRVTAIYVQ